MSDDQAVHHHAIEQTSSHNLSQRTDTIKVAVFGAYGRMGQQIIQLMKTHSRLSCVLEIHRDSILNDLSFLVKLAQCHVLIDFSVASAQSDLLKILYHIKRYKDEQISIHNKISNQSPLAIVSGVTGQSINDLNALYDYATYAPVFHAPNFSLGIALLKRFTKEASLFLGDSFDIEVFELHHRQKKDAPSGTALHLAKAAKQGRQHEDARVIETFQDHRHAHDIHVSAGRGGQVIGEHFVYFLGQSERIELVHRAHDRNLFAQGALRATEWIYQRSPQRYSMDDLWES
jgi:4-hydroxy-tetrahydrodipicolinate reductase